MEPSIGDSRKEGVAESGAVFGHVRRESEGEAFRVRPGDEVVDGEQEPARSSELALLMLFNVRRLGLLWALSVVSMSSLS